HLAEFPLLAALDRDHAVDEVADEPPLNPPDGDHQKRGNGPRPRCESHPRKTNCRNGGEGDAGDRDCVRRHAPHGQPPGQRRRPFRLTGLDRSPGADVRGGGHTRWPIPSALSAIFMRCGTLPPRVAKTKATEGFSQTVVTPRRRILRLVQTRTPLVTYNL